MVAMLSGPPLSRLTIFMQPSSPTETNMPSPRDAIAVHGEDEPEAK